MPALSPAEAIETLFALPRGTPPVVTICDFDLRKFAADPYFASLVKASEQQQQQQQQQPEPQPLRTKQPQRQQPQQPRPCAPARGALVQELLATVIRVAGEVNPAGMDAGQAASSAGAPRRRTSRGARAGSIRWVWSSCASCCRPRSARLARRCTTRCSWTCQRRACSRSGSLTARSTTSRTSAGSARGLRSAGAPVATAAHGAHGACARRAFPCSGCSPRSCASRPRSTRLKGRWPCGERAPKAGATAGSTRWAWSSCATYCRQAAIGEGGPALHERHGALGRADATPARGVACRQHSIACSSRRPAVQSFFEPATGRRQGRERGRGAS